MLTCLDLVRTFSEILILKCLLRTVACRPRHIYKVSIYIRSFLLPKPFIAGVLMNIFSALALERSEGMPIAATKVSVCLATASLELWMNTNLPIAGWQSLDL